MKNIWFYVRARAGSKWFIWWKYPKVVVAREFSSYNKLIVCDQPTRGIDVGASEFIRRRMIQMRDEGKAILLISADLGEIMNLSDSLIVMYGGEIGAYFPDITDLSEEEWVIIC